MEASQLRYGFITYDFEMRKFIKEKFGVEIESPVKKWSKLCWNSGWDANHLSNHVDF